MDNPNPEEPHSPPRYGLKKRMNRRSAHSTNHDVPFAGQELFECNCRDRGDEPGREIQNWGERERAPTPAVEAVVMVLLGFALAHPNLASHTGNTSPVPPATTPGRLHDPRHTPYLSPKDWSSSIHESPPQLRSTVPVAIYRWILEYGQSEAKFT